MMKHRAQTRRLVRGVPVLAFLLALSGATGKGDASAAQIAPLTLEGQTKVSGYTGDFDHFAVDTKNSKLYLAGEDGAALEVFDLRSGAFLRSIKGYGVPHSLLLMPRTGELLVIDGAKPSQILDARTLDRKRTIKLPAGADSVDYDGSTGHLWIVTGGKDVPQADSNLIAIDPASGKIFTTVHFNANHVEALAVEQRGNLLFINVTDKNTLAVVNKQTGKIVHWWPITAAQQNAPVAFDERRHRLFVVTRKPGMLVVLNADTGATIASLKAPERTDQVIWDAGNRRVYVTGGDGYIGVFAQLDADRYVQVAHVRSAAGAKTAILVPSLKRLYVAASPGDTKAGGAVLRFGVAPATK